MQKNISVSSEQWIQLKKTLKTQLTTEHSSREQIERRTEFYFSILRWIADRVQTELAQPQSRQPVILGLNGPQGSGKTTLGRVMGNLFPLLGLKTAHFSIDDFYLTRKDQIKLAETYPTNSLFQQRGYPGTHDVALGLETLQKIRNLEQNSPILIPRYDKTQHHGQGDRLPQTEWQSLDRSLHCVLLEGWMLGFTPVEPSLLPQNEEFFAVNQALGAYQQWVPFLQGFIHFVAENPQDILSWRIEAEEKVRNQGKPAMTLQQITEYIQRFIPAYEVYVPQLLQHPPLSDPSQKVLRFILDKDRLPSLTG